MAHRPEEVYCGGQGEALSPDVYKIGGLTMREAVRQLGEQRVKQVFRKLYVDHLLSMDMMGKVLKKSSPPL